MFINLKNAVKKYGQGETAVYALNHASLELEQGKICVIPGIIICISAVYVAVNLTATENRHNISMLKVLGYTNREIGKTVLRVHHLPVLLGIVLEISFPAWC